MLAGLRRKRGPNFRDGALLPENVLLLDRLDRRRMTSVLSVANAIGGNICQTICKPGGHERYDVGLWFMRWRRRRRPVDGCRFPVFRLDDDGRFGFLCRFVAPENHVTYPGCVSGRITTLLGADTAAPGRPLVTDCRTAIMAAP